MGELARDTLGGRAGGGEASAESGFANTELQLPQRGRENWWRSTEVEKDPSYKNISTQVQADPDTLGVLLSLIKHGDPKFTQSERDSVNLKEIWIKKENAKDPNRIDIVMRYTHTLDGGQPTPIEHDIYFVRQVDGSSRLQGREPSPMYPSLNAASTQKLKQLSQQ